MSGMDAPNEFQPLMDAIFREKVLRAREDRRNRTEASRLDLYEKELKQRGANIRAAHPEFSDEQVSAEIAEWYRKDREEADKGFFSTRPPDLSRRQQQRAGADMS